MEKKKRKKKKETVHFQIEKNGASGEKGGDWAISEHSIYARHDLSVLKYLPLYRLPPTNDFGCQRRLITSNFTSSANCRFRSHKTNIIPDANGR